MPSSLTSKAERWRAVKSRSASGDGHFVYAVRTTGVFCRPSCPARRPRPENVEFFDSAEAATRAGYRPCKRCRPTEGPSVHHSSELMVRACRRLASDEPVQTAELARTLGLSASYFQRLFKAHFGVSPQQYRRRVRAERGREVLGTARSVTESIYEAGYSSSSRFYEGLGSELGMAPSTALAGAPGERIRYVITECSLGHVLIAWTERGVCEVAFTDSLEELRPRLERHFPSAELEPCDEGEWAQAIVDAVEMKSCPDIPLDMHGTAFQERVWRALRAIPAGETRNYSEIAELIGQPSAVRAVATACASNPVAFLVPCHRVVRKDGSLSGYRWGVERKRELLRREAVRKNESRELDEGFWAKDGGPRYRSEVDGRLGGSGDEGDDER